MHGTQHGHKRPKKRLNPPLIPRLGDMGTLLVAQMRRALASSLYGDQGDDPTSRPAGHSALPGQTLAIKPSL